MCDHEDRKLVRYRHYLGDFVAWQCAACGWVLDEDVPEEAIEDETLPDLDVDAYEAALDERTRCVLPVDGLRTRTQVGKAMLFLYAGRKREHRWRGR